MPDTNPMRPRLASSLRPAGRPGRLRGVLGPAAWLQTLLFAATMAAAPLLHQATCGGVCSALKLQVLGVRSAAGDSCCHPGAPAGHGASKGCGCLDDCCSLAAHFVPPAVVADLAPPTRVVAPAPGVPPASTPRAPSARLLPFPTGPPSTS